MKEFYEFLQIILKNKKYSFTVATVIQVEGSAYRHEGAKMLFSETGAHYGIISGGCLEEDLQSHAMEVMATKYSKIVSYDLRAEDDGGWGQGAGCNGKVMIYLEPIAWFHNEKYGNNHSLEVVWNTLNQGGNVTSVREVSEGEILEAPKYFYDNGESIGEDTGMEMERTLFEKLHQFLSDDDRFFECVTIEVGHKTFLLERYEGKDTLYIFGAGVDVEPIVERVSEVHFSPVVIDPRPSRCQKRYFPNARELITEHPETFLANHILDVGAYVLIMTHNFSRDQYLLNYFIRKLPQPKYIGILGARGRTERLIYPEIVPDRVHSPVGLNIYAEGADEISISILGELIQVRNKKRALVQKKNNIIFKEK